MKPTLRNPIRTRKDWESQRQAARENPGKFHGDIAKREVHWYHAPLKAWIKQSEDATWHGFDAATGKPLRGLGLPAAFEPWKRAFNPDAAPFYRWFEGGLTNACFNEVDAHVLAGHGAEIAFHFEGEAWDAEADGGKGSPKHRRAITRLELFREVARRALVLQGLGLKKGDRIALNMPNIPEQIFFIEAAKRLGIIFTPVFGGFSAATLADRLQDSGARLLITTDGAYRNGQVTRTKQEFADPALAGGVTGVEAVVVVRHAGLTDTPMTAGRDHWCDELLAQADQRHGLAALGEAELVSTVYRAVPPVPVDSEHPLFIMYTSGSTGKPKGVVHTHGGYTVGVAHTMGISFDVRAGDGKVMFVVADPAWITGQSYMISGALLTRTTSVLAEGSPIYPHAGRFASIIERYRVNVFKAGSTFLKAVSGDSRNVEELKRYDLSSLDVATFCAEPTSPAIQQFGMEMVTPRYINSYWATEHGGIVMTHFHGNTDFPLRADAHTFPMPWVLADVWVTGEETAGADGRRQRKARRAAPGEKGELVLTAPYPCLVRTIWGDAARVGTPEWKGDLARFQQAYFPKWNVEGADPVEWAYTQGDYACRYADEAFSLHGRSDEVINTQGHRIGTEEIEGAILMDRRQRADSPVGNVIVVGAPHAERGTVPLAFVLTPGGRPLAAEDERRLNALVVREKGEVAIPAAYLAVSQFPETRSGKYMRRYLQAMLEGTDLGDTSTLRNPESLTELRTVIDGWKGQCRPGACEAPLDRPEGELRARVEETPSAAKHAAVEACLLELLAEVLTADNGKTVRASELRPQAPLKEQGMDSLKALKLANRIKRAVGAELGRMISVTAIFNHGSVSGLTDYLCREVFRFEAADAPKTKPQRRRADEPIAVVGMACRFPGDVNTPEEFWKLLLEGRDAVGEIPRDRWSQESVFDADPSAAGKSYVRKGGFLKGVDQFDAQFFGISPTEAKALDPQQRLLLELAWEALERSGISPDKLEGSRGGTFIGITMREYAELIAKSKDREELEIYTPTGTNLNTAAGRISFALGMRGPSMVVDTACSSSLVAVHLACDSLRNGDSEVALAGGVNMMLTPDFTVSMCRAQALSPTGSCNTFDESGNGYVRSEGAGLVVLKRLSQALADGDTVHAVILGTAVNHNGKGVSLTAPNGISQEELVRDALARAGVPASQVGFVEAHGTGTPLGDPIEAQALANVYKEGRDRGHPLLIGSVKTNIGHAESAAGIAGLIKTVLALKNRQIPRNLHFSRLNPHIQLEHVPARVPAATTPWEPIGGKRIAGVSSFGFSGTGAHVVLAEAPAAPARVEAAPAPAGRVLCLSARSEAALSDQAREYASFLRANPQVSLDDLCASAWKGRAHLEHRLAISADSVPQLLKRLDESTGDEPAQGTARGKAWSESAATGGIAFLFAGQGSQYPGMAKTLFETEPVFRAEIERCARALEPYLPKSLLKVLFDKSEEASLINDPIYAQTALCSIEYSMARLWMSWGVLPAALMGHSMGEYVAACLAGIYSVEDALRLVVRRVQLVAGLTRPGEMGAVMAGEEKVRAALEGFGETVSIAAVNGPDNTVITGEREGVKQVLKKLDGQGVKTKLLTIGWASHSPLVEPILDEFEREASQIRYSLPKIRLISNVTGEAVQGNEVSQASYWRRHVRQTVRFSQGIKVLLRGGSRIFIEMAPGSVVIGMGQLSQGDGAETRWLPSIRKDREDWDQLRESLGALYACGVPLDRAKLDPQNAARKSVALPVYPFQRKRFWVEPRADAPQATATAETRPPGHPLLGRRLQSPVLRDVIFEAEYSGKTLPFLAEHWLYGVIVVPGAAHVARVLMAARELLGAEASVALEDVVFLQPLAMEENGSRLAQLVLTPEGPRSFAFQICSRPTPRAGEVDGEATWTVHATGKVGGTDAKAPVLAHVSLADLQKRCPKEHGPAEIYASFKALGLDLGPLLQGIQRLLVNEGEYLSRLDTPRGLLDEVATHEILPTMMDSCFQTLAAQLMLRDQKGTTGNFYPPMSIERMVFHRRPGQAFWCHVAKRASGGSDDRTIKADLRLLDDAGTVLSEVVGLVMLEAPRETVLRRAKGADRVEDWLYEISWKPETAPAKTPVAQHWLVVGEGGGMAGAVAERIRKAGCAVTLAPTPGAQPLAADHFDRLLQQASSGATGHGPVRVALYLGALDAPQVGEAAGATDFEQAQRQGYGSALALAQALSRVTGAEVPRLVLVTRGAQPVSGPSLVDGLAQSPLWGLGKVLALEHPELRCLRLDLDPAEPVVGADSERIVSEVSGDPAEDQVGYRAGKRYVARVVRSALSKSRDRAKPAGADPYQQSVRLGWSARGVIDYLEFHPMPRRKPAEGEVEIRVQVTGLNFRDVMNLMAGPLQNYTGDPEALGGECTGEVVAVGPGVKDLKVGDTVLAVAWHSFDTYLIAPAATVVKKPDCLTLEEAATIPIAFLTVLHGFQQAGLKRGQTVLVHAAAGGVGQAAIQLARNAGAEVIATVSSPEKVALMKSLGIRHILNSRSLEFADQLMKLTDGKGVDVVLNSLAGEYIPKSISVLRQGGQFIEIGKTGIWTAEQVRGLRPDVGYHVIALDQMMLSERPKVRSLLGELLADFERGALKPLPHTVYPVTDVQTAFRTMAQGKHTGKLVISRRQMEAFRAEATYVIAGGLNGVGLKLADWMLGRGAKHLVLLGRRAPSDEAKAAIAAMNLKGAKVRAESVDIADGTAVNALFERLRQTMPPLRGVVNSAVVLSDGSVLNQTYERYLPVIAPKIAGSWNLHRATLKDQLDFFVMFSSSTSMLGNAGQANYAAAGAFQDTLAYYRRSKGLPAVTINWGPWEDTGLAAKLMENRKDAFSKNGMGSIPLELGFEAFWRVFWRERPQVGVLPVTSWEKLAAGYGGG